MAVNAGNEYPSDSASKYTPEVYSMKVMKIFTEKTIAGEICNNDYTGDIKGKGDTVNVRVAPTSMTVGDYTAGVDIVYETPTENARVLLIDKSKYVAFEVQDISETQSDIDLMNTFSERAGIYLAIDVDTDVLDVLGTYANHHADNKGTAAGKVSGSYNLGEAGAPVHVTTANAVEIIADLGTVLDEYNVPDEGRYIVIPAWFANLLKKGDLKQADITGDRTGVIRTGLIGEIDRFRCYQSNLIKNVTEVGIGVGGTDVQTFSVVAGVTDASTFAAQVTKTEKKRSEFAFSDKWRTLIVYGRKVIMPEATALLLATPSALA